MKGTKIAGNFALVNDRGDLVLVAPEPGEDIVVDSYATQSAESAISSEPISLRLWTFLPISGFVDFPPPPDTHVCRYR